MKRFFAHWQNDLPAGLVVFLVAIPLCLGIALSSGVPLFSGIISGILGGIVVGSLSGSQVSVSGPAAGLILIVLTAVGDMGGFTFFLSALVMAGILQIIMGYLKLGIVGMYFPASVIKGMLAAIGLILILQQLPYFLGVPSFDNLSLSTLREVLQPGVLTIGLVSMAILLIWEMPFVKRQKFAQFIPGPLVAVAAGIVLSGIFNSGWSIPSGHMVQIPMPESAREWGNSFVLPTFTWSMLFSGTFWQTAIVIALIASLETLLSLSAADKLDSHKRNSDKNRELKAQGVANSLSGLIGGLPITAVIVRSSANINAGAQSRLASIFHGTLLLSSVLFIPHLLNMIPYASLAAVLLLVGYKLTKPALYTEHYRAGWDQFIPFIVTVAAILATDLLVGIIIGLSVGVLFVLRNTYRVTYFYHEESTMEGNRQRIILRLSEHVSFLNKAPLQDKLDRLPNNSHVIIDGELNMALDYDIISLLKEFRQQAQDKDIQLEYVNIPGFS